MFQGWRVGLQNRLARFDSEGVCWKCGSFGSLWVSVMKEEIEQSLDKILEWAEAGEGFVLEQGPLVAQEIVAWTFWRGVLIGVPCVAVAVVIVAIGLWRAYLFTKSECEVDRTMGTFFALAIAGVLALGPALGAAETIPNAIKAAVAPRLVIIEYLSSLL